MNRAVASTLAFLAVLLAGCAHGKSEPTRRSLPSAPPGVADGCRDASDAAAFDVLCPASWPQATRPAKVRLRLYGSDAAYLLEAQSGFGSRAPVFHVLFGGQRKPFPARFEGSGRLLRLTTRRKVVPFYASPRGGRVLGHDVVEMPTRLIRTTRVHGQTAGILKAPPYPKGGIHGGHMIVMWNERGHGYLVSAHSERSPRAATQAAIQIARSSQPLSESLR
jgi:hypothetical protein